MAACGTLEPRGKAVLPEYVIRSLRLRCVLRTCHPFRITVSTNTHRSRRFRGSLLRVGRNSKRYRRHHPASPPWSRLAGTYPYNSKQSNPASCAATRLQLRCNPGSHRNVRTRLGIPPNPLRVRIVARVPCVCHRHCCRWRRFFGTPFFSIEFAFWRGRWRRPCVKYRFNSYTSRGLTAACRLYIQNEGLRENFWEDRANDLAKRCRSPFITDR